MPERRRVIAYFVTEDWYFCSHRLPLAIAAKNAGYVVYVITNVTNHGDVIRSAGLNLIPIELQRRGSNPIVEFRLVRKLIGIYREIRPQIVHHVALKPVIYGSIAAKLSGIKNVINALAGLGHIFSSGSTSARLARPIVKLLFRLLLNRGNARLILQNPDDVEKFCSSGIIDADRVSQIMGSGVDTEEYSHSVESDENPVILLASRLLWDKGIGEFIDAARACKAAGTTARFVVAGDTDPDNPGSIPQSMLAQWKEEADVEFLGRCDNMPEIIAASHIVCLPSYYAEGLPKVLIEAASSGRPIVTTDMPGCREIVVHGVNGLLVPARDHESLLKAIQTLLESKELRAEMGLAGRKMVEQSFSITIVVQATLALYESVLQ